MPLNSRAGRASWRSVSPTTISRSCGTSPVPLPAFDSYRGARRPLARSSQRPPHQADGLIARTPRRSELRYAAFPFRDACQCARYEPTGACVAGDGNGHAQSTVRSVNVGSYPGSARLRSASSPARSPGPLISTASASRLSRSTPIRSWSPPRAPCGAASSRMACPRAIG